MGLVSLEKKRLREDVISACQYLTGRCQVDGARLFFFWWCPVTEQKTMGTNWKVLPEQEKIFILRLTET